MSAQGLNGVVIARQLRLAQRGMDFVVTNLMKQYERAAFAASEFRDQVVLTLLDLGRDGPIAQRTDRVAHNDQSTIGPAGTMPRGLRSSDGEK